MTTTALLKNYANKLSQQIEEAISQQQTPILNGIKGNSTLACYLASMYSTQGGIQTILLSDKEEAAYLYNDLERLLEDDNTDFHRKKVVFLPSAFKHNYNTEVSDKAGLLSRNEIISRLHSGSKDMLIVSYAAAVAEKVVSKSTYERENISLSVNDIISQKDLIDKLEKYKFERVDFVAQPGEYAIRGGIIDVFSYAYDYPYRIVFFDDEIESLRAFEADTQLSIKKLKKIKILSDLNTTTTGKYQSFFKLLPSQSRLILIQADKLISSWQEGFQQAINKLSADVITDTQLPIKTTFFSPKLLQEDMQKHLLIYIGANTHNNDTAHINFNIDNPPHFNKQFNMLLDHLQTNEAKGWKSIIASASKQQLERIRQILTDLSEEQSKSLPLYTDLQISLHQGFLDADNQIALYTDHQIFNRYQGFKLRSHFKGTEAITIKELYGLVRGDYVSHIDYGIGRFDGLQKLNNNGQEQEVIRLLYKNDDVLFVNIHSLHKIAKHSAKDAIPPKISRLGSPAWNTLKNKTKKKIKDIADDLIKLYAERRNKEGVQFSPDTYLQTELEANFMYEDTPDQEKATKAVKADMEKTYPMDRLICGDVGFGKTEIAIRAAFKAVNDSKQVAILVPTTILAFQHYKTFSERLKDFPARVDYISRFRTQKEINNILKALKEGKIDILIGTHKIVTQTEHYKDLGLLIIDEEQKFGVSVKEKLKQFKVNIDTLTLSATPIPRTLQFSLMGARDLSIINTPPPNRQAVISRLCTFSPDIITEAITYELNRDGQVFFVHNRVQNIHIVAEQLRSFVPFANIAIAHGQMKGKELEQTMIDFMQGDYDVLLATKIIESGLDIPNVNTIIINEANHYGLSELHQMRGRVGRSNKKAFCYLLAPPPTMLTNEAKKRLKAIEEFSNLGSGFNIAMRDLDIRGAGNILGAEQSGFITDIGYELYQKILDNALSELKEENDNNREETKVASDYIQECQIDTDLSALFPTYYIENNSERLSLYKSLSKIEDQSTLDNFTLQLKDRFGSLPTEVDNLLQLIPIKWLAKDLGFEKISIKSNRMFAYFIENKDSSFFSSDYFKTLLNILLSMPSLKVRENNNRLSIVFRDINKLSEAKTILKKISNSLNYKA